MFEVFAITVLVEALLGVLVAREHNLTRPTWTGRYQFRTHCR
jgi:hypothetical protein